MKIIAAMLIVFTAVYQPTVTETPITPSRNKAIDIVSYTFEQLMRRNDEGYRHPLPGLCGADGERFSGVLFACLAIVV